MILLVCCLNLLVCDRNLWAYKARDILVDVPRPEPDMAALADVGIEKWPKKFATLLLCCCPDTGVCAKVKLSVEAVVCRVAVGPGEATEAAAVKVSTRS
jgi:hypothetical protein